MAARKVAAERPAPAKRAAARANVAGAGEAGTEQAKAVEPAARPAPRKRASTGKIGTTPAGRRTDRIDAATEVTRLADTIDLPRSDEGQEDLTAAPIRHRWSDAERRLFLATLAETANVRHSARAAGVLDVHAYKLRQQSASFRGEWAAALREGYARLEMRLLEKALAGELDPARDRVGLTLLAAHRSTVKGIEADGTVAGDARGRVVARLEEMRRRVQAGE